MLDRRLLGLIEMRPRGLTNGQLLWQLNSGGVRYDASGLMAALEHLAETGLVRFDGLRWQMQRRPASQVAADRGRRSDTPADPHAVLRGAPARLRQAPASAVPGVDTAEDSTGTLPDPARLLRYYAATQRQDPRGSVEAFPDQHGVKWHMFDCAGQWWSGSEIVIATAMLEPGFLQALAETGETGVAAVGWPLAVLSGSTGQTCVPGLLVPVSWTLRGEDLIIRPDEVEPAFNPAFLRPVRRKTGLREDALLQVLEPGEEGVTLDVAARRLARLLAKIGGQALRPGELVPEITLAGDGLHNAAALFLPDETTFTRRVARDLDLIAEWDEAQRNETALGLLLAGEADGAAAPERDAEVLGSDTLTDRQFQAIDAALSNRVTLVQGPPGTGKSHAIVTLISSALAAGQNVLFVARNHRALDEVEGRLAALFPDSHIFVRARDAAGERDVSMFDALAELVNGEAAPDETASTITALRSDLSRAARSGAAGRRNEIERTRLHLELAEFLEREEAFGDERDTGESEPATRSSGWFARFLSMLWPWAGRHQAVRGQAGGPRDIAARITACRARIAQLPPSSQDAPPDLRAPLAQLARKAGMPDADTLAELRTRKAELEFQRGAAAKQPSARDAQHVLRFRPIWAVSTLSVPARIPLAPALFDLAIFDEASQCDIASALPVMARARRAVIVGDPEQLSFIPSLGVAQEHALMDSLGLPANGRAGWAQSRNSLFDFARLRLPADHLHLLPDQFRSAPEIVAYTSDAFYGGRLRARRSDDDFTPPRGYRPGLHWQDIAGPCSREDGGNVNRSEAEWIVERIATLGDETDFDGSIGVISPFNAQVGLIRRLLEARIAPEIRDRLGVNVDTVDGWQGGEADVVFFSLATGPDAARSATTFLTRERRRFNVAVSRARAVAVIVGNLTWARHCGVAHIETLAERATRPRETPQRGFDSKWERRVHAQLVARGLDPKPQFPVGSRSLDFALFHKDIRLDLEVDGRKWHTGVGGERKVADRLRDRELIVKGWKVRRFWVDELAADMEGCLDTVERDLGIRN